MEKRKCVPCQKEERTLNHLIEECIVTPRGIKPNRRGCAWKNKREGEGMVKRLGKEEEKKKRQECRVEEHNPQMHKSDITIYF